MSLKYKWRLMFGLIAIFFASGFQLAIPILIGSAVDAARSLDESTVEIANPAVVGLIDGTVIIVGESNSRKRKNCQQWI